MSKVTGEYLRIDDNYKLVRYIHSAAGGRTYVAMETTMNEYGQVQLCVLRTDGTSSNVEGAHRLLVQRYALLGAAAVEAIWVDNTLAQVGFACGAGLN